MLEDKFNALDGGIPENKQRIHEEYDEYVASGGNSYVHDKVKEYDEWYKTLSKKR